MIDDPHLAHIPSPPKCGNCASRPRLLPDGNCTGCGMERTPLYIPTAAVAQLPSPLPDEGLGPPPVSSDWMRAPIPGDSIIPFSSRPNAPSGQRRDEHDAAQGSSSRRQHEYSSVTTTREATQQLGTSRTERTANANLSHNNHVSTPDIPSTNDHATRAPPTSSARARTQRKR